MSSLRYLQVATWVAAGVLVLPCAPLPGATPDSLWGPDRGCLEGRFTRDKPISEKARTIGPINQDDDFSLKFRFRTAGRGSYAAVVYVGVRQSGPEWNVNGLGVDIFRHNEEIGLVALPFVWDSTGESHRCDQRISLEYDRTYDVCCAYTAADKTLGVSVYDAVGGEQIGATSTLRLPADVKWSADRLACWNHADGHSPKMQLTVLLDRLQLDDGEPLNFAADLAELPIGDDPRFTWRQAPLDPLIPELKAPREVLADEDARFEAVVQQGLTGSVRFSLKTYSGEAVWAEDAEIEEGRASVVLAQAEAADLEKGSRVLVATANGQEDRCAYVAVRLRGRVFRDLTEAPAKMKPGDELLLGDVSLLQPSGAVSERSVKGKWWLRQYTMPDAPEPRSLLTVEEQDPEDPASCLAPPLRLPLKLDGWYEVWVRTYRRPYASGQAYLQGGIDVRLSGEPCFWHASPFDVSSVPGPPPLRGGNLVDVLYRAADLTGQDLIFQQPYGTYPSDTKRCDASLAGVRLVKLSREQVARVQAERERDDTSIIAYDDDGFSYFWKWAVDDPTCIARLAEPLRDGSAAFFNLELGGLGGLTVPTPYTGMYQMSSGHVRDGDFRANAFFRWCFEEDVQILNVLIERAHQVGLKVFASLMMERCFSWDDAMRSHPKWRIQRGKGTWDYALEEVQDYQVKKIAWIIENHDLDGFVVDFTRYGHFFNEDQPDKFAHMNRFLRRLRGAVDEVNDGKPPKSLLCASFGDRSWHLKHWGSGVLADQGLDVKTWLDEGLFDIIMPEGPGVERFVEMAAGSRTRVWPRKVAGVTLSTHAHVDGKLGPKEIEREVKWALDRGAAGVFFFNHETWGALRRLGFKEELELRTRVDEVYGYREGPAVAFSAWYPSLEERVDQRTRFKPLTITPDAERRVDGELVVAVPNAFTHPVTAVVDWVHPAGEESESWTITPASRSIEIAPGEEGNVTFHLSGTAAGHKATPTANVELRADQQVLFRHRVPLRAVPRMVCREVHSTPTIDGDLSDSAWAEAGGLQSYAFFRPGQSGPAPWKTEMAFAHDNEKLYVAYACSGMDVRGIKPDAQEGDSVDVFQSNHVQVLLDPAATEQAYVGLVTTPGGRQADYRAYYDDFAGQFRRNRDWHVEWEAGTAPSKDGYCVELAIPFAALGARPRPGGVWRLNVAAQSETGDGKRSLASWASPENAFHLPRHSGTLHGSLMFAE